ncbi:MAG TPA: glutathione-disulfide reductase [Beijerinckiaceae bacterium]|nr:glutathione-disulfide reductase [Beijerinckiaceae bacterium]
MSGFDVDFCVIGGGSGGVRSARIAAGYGAKVLLAEEFRMGGTCVIRGCVPKKLYVYASRFSHEFEEAAGFGWSVPNASFNWPTLVKAKEAEITRLEGLYARGQASAGVEVVKSRAVFEDAHTVRLVADSRLIRARHILIATGGRPFLPAIPGVEHAITSSEAFDLAEQPRRIVIAGGGYIAVEFAGIFAGLGSEVTLVHRGDNILRGFDDDLRNAVKTAYEKRGIRLLLGDTIARIDKGDGLAVTTAKGETIAADQVMLALGRVPNVEGLGLDKAGVALRHNHHAIAVNAASQTSVPHIYAVGDVTDRVNLTPVAIREGHAVADTLFGNKPWTVDHANIATAVFSQPELGTVGLTEAQARDKHRIVDIYRTEFRPMKATLSGSADRVLMKIIVDGETDRVLGVHIAGEAAGEMAQLLGIAVRMGATKADFDATMAVHPTAAEELVTLRTRTSRWERDAQ